MFDFPASPANGQRFAPAGGPTYVFSSGVWKIEGSIGAPGNLSMSDTPPASPQPGQMWWETDSGNLFTWYNDGDSSQWVQINVPNVSGLSTSQARNRIVNPAMQISQENGNTGGTTTGYYPADQWCLNFAGITNVGANRSASTPSGYQILTSFGTAKPSLGVSDFAMLTQTLEGSRIADFNWGTASALPLILRFEVFAGVAGTFSVAIRNLPTTHSWVGAYTVSTANVWTPITLVIPKATVGTWKSDASAGAELDFTFVCGSTLLAAAGWNAGSFVGVTGMTNGAASSTGYYIRNVGLYLDPTNSGVPPPWQMPDEAQELTACMRYWAKTISNIRGPAITGAGSLGNTIVHPQPMRAIPAVTVTPGSRGNISTVTASPNSTVGTRWTVTATAVNTDTYALDEVVTLNARM